MRPIRAEEGRAVSAPNSAAKERRWDTEHWGRGGVMVRQKMETWRDKATWEIKGGTHRCMMVLHMFSEEVFHCSFTTIVICPKKHGCMLPYLPIIPGNAGHCFPFIKKSLPVGGEGKSRIQEKPTIALHTSTRCIFGKSFLFVERWCQSLCIWSMSRTKMALDVKEWLEVWKARSWKKMKDKWTKK